jgi:nucleotide-binding universal stress UspA family protein
VTGVVVGVGRAGSSGPAVRWACAEAAVRGVALALVHAWDEPLDLLVELVAGSLPDVSGPATSHAVQGAAAGVLLAQHPDLLVLGGHRGARRLPGITRACLHGAGCPVVVVPDSGHSERRRATRRVVVGVNGSAASLGALAWAAQEAQLQVADLVVVHAWQVHPTSARQVLQPALAMSGQQGAALDRLRGWVREALGTVDVELHAIHGGPLDRLLDLSADADLLVLGRGTPSGVGRWLHGAVSDDLTALAPCPVAVIPGLAKTVARAG